MDKNTAILLGGNKDWDGHLIENVSNPTIWTPFEEYVKTDIITEEGYVVYMFNEKR